MIPLLVSIILGFLCFIFVANLYQVRLPRAPEIEKRLESIKKSKRFYPYLGTHGFSDYQVVDSFSKCNPHTIKLNYEIVLRDLVVSIKMILDVFVRNLQFIIYHATENMKNKREKLGQLN